MSNIEREIEKLVEVAKRSRGDAGSLYEIANRLRQLGATDQADRVLSWAHQAEKRWAEEAAR